MMQNKYQVKIDDSVIPELYSFDQLIDAGLLDDIDENIKIKLKGETAWITARSYPFASIENFPFEQAEHKSANYHHYSPKSVGVHARHVHCNSDVSARNCPLASSPNPSRRVLLDYPSIVDKWNWGAFCLSWFWGICNGLYWPLVIIALNFIPYFGIIISLCICLYLGKFGNEYAWRIAKKKGVSLDSFCNNQSQWNVAGICFAVFVIIALIMYFIIYIL